MGWQDESTPVNPGVPGWQQQSIPATPADPTQAQTHILNSPGVQTAKTPLDILHASFQQSASSLALLGRPNMALPQNMSFAQKLLAGIGQGVGDLPFIALGTSVGGAVGGPGGAAAGSMAVPEAVRQTMMDYYDRGEINNSSDFLRMLAHNAWEIGKAGVVGRFSAYTGGLFQRATAPLTDRAIAQSAAGVTGYTLGATEAQAGLEGRMPDAQDFGLAAANAVGFHLVGKGQDHVVNNVKAIYRNTGVTPWDQTIAARRDPVLAQELLTTDVNGKAVIPHWSNQAPQSPPPYHTDDPHYLPPPEHAEQLLNALKHAGEDTITEGVARANGIDPAKSIKGGTQIMLPYSQYDDDDLAGILARYSERFQGDSDATLIAFKDGADTANEFLRSGKDPSVLSAETQEYLQKLVDIDTNIHGIFNTTTFGDWKQFEHEVTIGTWPDGTQKAAPGVIAHYLENFGRRAGFRFVVEPANQPAGSPDTTPMPQRRGAMGPYYVGSYKHSTVGREVHIPLDPDELQRRWYGLGNFEVVYHEVGHALDHTVLHGGPNSTSTFSERSEWSDELHEEMIASSKVFRPKLWELSGTGPGAYNMRPAELMADNIAMWLSQPSFRPNMKLFGEKYGAILEPYSEMAERALPIKSGGTPEGMGEPTGPGFPPGPPPLGGAGAGGKWNPPPGSGGPPSTPGGRRRGRRMPPNTSMPPPKDWSKVPDDVLQTRFESHIGTPKPLERPQGGTGFETELSAATALDNTMKRIGILDPDKMVTTEDMFRMPYSSMARALHWIKYGGITADFKPNGAPSLKSVADEIKAQPNGSRTEFNRYVLSLRHIDLEKRGIDSGMFEPGEAEQNVKNLQGKYAKANEMFQKFNDSVLVYLHQSGVISKEQLVNIKLANPNYMSLRRLMGDDLPFEMRGPRWMRVRDPLYKIEGSDRQIIDPWKATIDNVKMMIKMADRNRAISHVVASEEIRKAWNLQKVPGAATVNTASGAPYKLNAAQLKALEPFMQRGGRGGTQFVHYEDGKATVWQARDEDLARLIRGADSPGEVTFLNKLMTMPARLQRAGIVSDPGFAFGIPLKHQWTAWSLDKRSPPPYITMIRGLYHMYKKDELYQDALAHGVMTGALEDAGEYVRTEALETLDKTGALKAAWNTVRHPLQFAQLITETMTNGSRVGYFARGRDSEDPLKVAMGARKAYIDYQEQFLDSTMQRWARWTPFFKAGVFGLRQGWNAAIENPVHTTAKIVMGLLVPQIALYMINREQDKYLPPDQQYINQDRQLRHLYYLSPVIGPNGYRVKMPRPFVIGPLIGAPMEAMLDHVYSKDPHAFDNLLHDMGQDAFPSAIPAAVKPIIEHIANYSFYSGHALVPEQLSHTSGDMQFTENTTEVSKAIATYLGPHRGIGVADVSPIVLDNYAHEWFGIGLNIANALGASQASAKPDQWTQSPFVKSFFLRHAGVNNAAVDAFYADAEAFDKAHYDKALEVRRGDLDDARVDAVKQRVIMLDHFKHTLNLMRGRIVDIANAPDSKLNTDQKRQFTDRIVNDAIAVAQLGSKILRSNTYDPGEAALLANEVELAFQETSVQ